MFSGKVKVSRKSPFISEFKPLIDPDQCRMFTLAEIRKATNDFKDDLRIGVGGFGDVYRGVINHGGGGGTTEEVAIKRVDCNAKLWFHELRTEIEMLSKLRHRHLLSLIGLCLEDSKCMMVVCDYMAHGNLCQHLYGSKKTPLGLPWKLRVEICVGAARGLHYLHVEATSRGIINLDVNASNVLLDYKWSAKLSYFGLYMQGNSNNPASTVGCLKTEQLGGGSEESDMYSFGVLLFEVLCARPALDMSLPDDAVSLAKWALNCQEKGMVEEIIDPNLKGKITPECLKMFVDTASLCLANYNQATMGDVLRNLEFALHLEERTANVPRWWPPTTGLDNMDGRRCLTSLLPHCQRFSCANIKFATGNFDERNRIGGRFYKGAIRNQSQLAIKLGMSYNEYKTEIAILSRLRHCNLVFLIGYCNENSEMSLIYDYMARRDLGRHLYHFKLSRGDLGRHLYHSKLSPLPWKTRLRICIGVARALNYLHNGVSSEEVIIHGNVNTKNILLDDNFVPKLSGFGRTRGFSQDPEFKGNIGYMDPECSGDQQQRILTDKSDVYSFGVVLLEVLCARPAVDMLLPSNQAILAKWARHCQKNGTLEKIIDPYLKKEISFKCVEVFVETTMQCLAESRVNRPTMRNVLRKLEFVLLLQDCWRFTFAEIRKATNDFDEVLLIGEDSFGKIYRGAIDGGAIHVAIKRKNPEARFRLSEYQNEIEMIFKLHHYHLVSLIGFCVENLEMIIVFEYMAFGRLCDHLYQSLKPPLLWKKRLEICIGVACGLNYLHGEATSKAIVHGGVQTSNIFLGSKWVSKLAYFGQLTRSMTEDLEDPPLDQNSEKSDVYSFGVVLFEVLCARPALDPSLPRNQVRLYEWAIYCYKNDTVEEIMDPHLKGKIRPECFRKFVDTAVKCLAYSRVDPPTMGEVLSDLELALRMQECKED